MECRFQSRGCNYHFELVCFFILFPTSLDLCKLTATRSGWTVPIFHWSSQGINFSELSIVLKNSKSVCKTTGEGVSLGFNVLRYREPNPCLSIMSEPSQHENLCNQTSVLRGLNHVFHFLKKVFPKFFIFKCFPLSELKVKRTGKKRKSRTSKRIDVRASQRCIYVYKILHKVSIKDDHNLSQVTFMTKFFILYLVFDSG